MTSISRMPLQRFVRERFELLAQAAEDLFEGNLELSIDYGALVHAVEAYALLNQCYKELHGITRTEPPKVAAMMALTLTDFQPLRLTDPANVRLRPSIYANEDFALSLAATFLGHALDSKLLGLEALGAGRNRTNALQADFEGYAVGNAEFLSCR